MNSRTDIPHTTPSFAAALRFWFVLGCISFGGPAGQIAVMHTELVDKRRWIDEASFLRALNVCMLLPGPEAMQLAAWLGWRLHGTRGGFVAGGLFVLPAAVLLAVLSWLYLRFGESPIATGVVFGLQAAVLGIIAHAARKIGGRVLKTPFAVGLAVVALAAIAFASVPFPALVLGAALVGLAMYRWRPRWLGSPASGHGAPPAVIAGSAPPQGAKYSVRIGIVLLLAWWLPLLALAAWPGPDSTAFAMGLFFSKAALVTFGGAYAVLPYVAEEAVRTHGWLDAGQMMAGLGLAETTPGPLVLVLEFVGFVGGWQHPDLASPLASAVLAAAVTLWATFLPSFLFVLVLAPWIDRIGNAGPVAAALTAVTAAVVGVIAHLALWFGAALLSEQTTAAAVFALAVAAVTYTGLSRWHWPVAAVVVGAGVVGPSRRRCFRSRSDRDRRQGAASKRSAAIDLAAPGWSAALAAQLRDRLDQEQHRGAEHDADERIERHADQRATRAVLVRLDEVLEHRDAVHEDAAADQEHRGGAGDRKEFHEPGREAQQRGADRAACPARAPAQRNTEVVELHDAADESVHADGHDQRDRHEHREPRHERLRGDGAERDHDDLGREDEVGAHRAFDLVALERDHVNAFVRERLDVRGVMLGILGLAVQVLVREFLDALVAQERTADDHQWDHRPRRDRADHERGRHEDRLVDQRALRDRPHDRQLAVGADAGDLLRIEREVVAEHARGLLRRDLRHHRDVVEDRGDVVDEREQAGSGHGRTCVGEGRGSVAQASWSAACVCGRHAADRLTRLTRRS
jgi:chromate transporter